MWTAKLINTTMPQMPHLPAVGRGGDVGGRKRTQAPGFGNSATSTEQVSDSVM
jgi:hypothetical protein